MAEAEPDPKKLFTSQNATPGSQRVCLDSVAVATQSQMFRREIPS